MKTSDFHDSFIFVRKKLEPSLTKTESCILQLILCDKNARKNNIHKYRRSRMRLAVP